MKTKFHIEITQKALSGYFSEKALQTIIHANINQDRAELQFGHDYIHFDGNAFDTGFQYISDQEQFLFAQLEQGEIDLAWQAFGRILHSWQDFYSHSNYVILWRNDFPDHQPEEIVFDDHNIMKHPDLKSGKNYGMIEFIAMLPLLSANIKPLMPSDSHARMNLDSPSSGPNFVFAYSAASKRTKAFYHKVIQSIRKMDDCEHSIKLFNAKEQEK